MNSFFEVLMSTVSSTPPVVNNNFEMEITTTSTNQSVTIPHASGYVYNYTIDYGDGNIKTVTTYNGAGASNTYATIGTYTIKISGTCETIYVNNTGTLRLLVKRVLNWGRVGFKLVNFYGCSNLTSIAGGGSSTDLGNVISYQNAFRATKITIPSGIFDTSTGVTDNGFRNTFTNTMTITSIPTDLFKYNTKVSTYGFAGVFQECTGLTSLPTDLFKYNTNVSTYGFQNAFNQCSGLTTIPTDLFRYNTKVSTNGFQNCFIWCRSLNNLPNDLFRYNTAVTTLGFTGCFNGCSSLTSLPTDLFRYNTSLTTDSFYQTFYDCTSLETIPDLLFKYTRSCTTNTYYQTFYGCNKLQINPWTFYASGETGTRFSGVTNVSFYQCFYRTSFTGTQGTAPDIWNCTFGTGKTTTQMYGGAGNSATSLSNYTDIPATGYK